jgi:hypothetical protein
MELKEFIGIFAKDRKVFFGIILGMIVLGSLVFRFQPDRYQASLILNVTRGGSIVTPDYRYDQFYRLQADERFADTVVRWLGAPRIRADIAAKAGGMSPLSGFTAKRLSSQMIEVTYVAGTPARFREYASALAVVVNAESVRLNEQAKDADWFIVVADEPVIASAKIPFAMLFLGSLALGLFTAFWVVLIRRYWKQ